jgi:hypothetical protein
MSADERVLVSQLLQPRPFDLSDLATGCLRFVIVPIAGIAVGGLVYVPISPLLVNYLAPNFTMSLCLALGFVGSIVFLWRDAQSGRSRFRDPLEHQVMQDLAGGEVEVLSATATQAIAVEGTVEHDPGIFLDVEPDTLLFLQGSYLKDVMGGARPPFPSTAFELVRLPHSHITLRVEPAGEPFRFARMRRPLDAALEYQPDDAELLPASLDTLEADLASLK